MSQTRTTCPSCRTAVSSTDLTCPRCRTRLPRALTEEPGYDSAFLGLQRCDYHPDHRASVRCGGCHKWICSECEINLFGQSYCSRCIYLYQDLPSVFKRLARETQEKVRLAQEHERMEADLRHAEETRRLYAELQANYKRLTELEGLRDSLIHMVVHDLRTPLTSLLTGLQSVPNFGELNTDQAEIIDMATRGGKELLEMINELLDISKMDEGSLKLEYEEVRFTDLAGWAVAQVGPLAEEKKLTVTVNALSALPTFCADPDKLRRLLLNLAANAVKFTPDGGTVTIWAKLHDGKTLHFGVTDTGEGIPPEAFEKIFEKFGQVETRKGGRKASSGLGLTFCRMVAEAHHGRIWVESDLGKGSTFHVLLPLAPPAG